MSEIAKISHQKSPRSKAFYQMMNRKSAGHKTHGSSKNRFYKIWAGMIVRTKMNSNRRDFVYYAGKGIGVSKSWKKFENFKNDMERSYHSHVKLYGTKNTTLERVDRLKGYSIKNCIWATHKVQANNRSTNLKYRI